MQPLETVTESNFLLFAAQNYYKPRFADSDEFYEDLSRFKYIKRLLNRYTETGKLSDRLILNHVIVVFNVFGIYPALQMFEVKLSEEHWPIIKPFFIKLQALPAEDLSDIQMDQFVVEQLRKI
jgi:hypothetical protein